MINYLEDMRWTIIVGVLIGVLVSPLSGISPLLPLYDTIWPVVVMQGKVVDRGPDSVTLSMWGRKNRNCEFRGLQGFSKQEENGLARDAIGMRMDLPSIGATKPKGDFDIGIWRFHPVINAKIVEVYVQHDCAGRAVVTRIARVEL